MYYNRQREARSTASEKQRTYDAKHSKKLIRENNEKEDLRQEQEKS